MFTDGRHRSGKHTPMTSLTSQHLRILATAFVIEQLPHDASPGDGWQVLVRAPEGLTVVREAPPAGPPEEERWIAFYGGATAHDLDVPGMLAAIVEPLAEAAVPVFVASTVHADLVLVPRQRRERAVMALREAGHQVEEQK